MRNIKGIGVRTAGVDFGLLTYIAEMLDGMMELFREDPKWVGKRGGYFCLADSESGLPLVLVCIGEVPGGKAEECFLICQEKAKRLAERPEHLSSWASRDPVNKRWGGAVRAGSRILSFSGLPEPGDEALMLAAAYRFLGESMDAFDLTWRVAAQSNNPYWSDAYHALVNNT